MPRIRGGQFGASNFGIAFPVGPGRQVAIRTESTTAAFGAGTLSRVVAAGNELHLAQCNAMNFNGSSQYVSTGVTGINALGNLTFECWLNFTSTANGYVMVSSDTNATTNRIGLRVNDAGAGKISADGWLNSANPSVATANAYNDGKWHHVAFVRNGVTWTLYVDGVQDGTTGSGQSTALATNWFTIGALRYGAGPTVASYYTGAVRDCRVYNVARTQANILADMYTVLTGSETNLVSVWQFSEGSGTAVADSSANANNGSATGAPTWSAVYYPSGNRIWPGLDMSVVGSASATLIGWSATVPANTSLLVEISLDGGVTWGTATSGAAVPGISQGDDLSGKTLLMRSTLSNTGDGTATPALLNLGVLVA